VTERAGRLLAERAADLVDGQAQPAAGELDEASLRALSWALKDLCYGCWSSDPQRAVRAAAALAGLREAVATTAAPAALQETAALAAWTQGVAALIQGEMTAAAEYFDSAAAAFSGIGRLHAAAQTQVPKIMALTMLGRHDDAVACATAAQQALLSHGDLQAASKVALNLGSLYLRSERFVEAAPHFRQAAALFERIGDHEHLVMADIGLGDTQAALGQPRAAADTYERARERAAHEGLPVLSAMVDESVALLDLARGRYRHALTGLERAREGYARLEMPQQLAIADKQLADAYLELRLLPEALAGLDAAQQRFVALQMQVDHAWTLVQRGRALAMAGQTGAATAALADGAALFATLDSLPGVAAVALARAELTLSSGAAVEACALAQGASRAFQQAGLVERQLRADCVCAQALWRSHEVAAARTLFDATLAAARELQLLPEQLRCLTGRAMTARAVGDLASARADLLAAVELFEDQRRTLPGDEVRSAFLGDHLLPFLELLRMALDAHDGAQAGAGRDAQAREVLVGLDRFRARALADRLVTESPGPQVRGDDPSARDLQARMAWLYRRVQRLHDDREAAATLGAQLRQAERAAVAHARRARLADGGMLGDGDRDGAELDAQALQASLAEGDALIEYGVLDDELFAVVLTPGAVTVQRAMASWRQVLEAVRWARFQLEAPRHGGASMQLHRATLEARAMKRMQALHALLWQPLAAALRDCRRVLVVPQAQLGAVPFAALHDGQTFVVDRHELAFAPSARIAARGLLQRPGPVTSVLALGESARLPHASREARAVAALLPRGLAFVGAEATVSNLLAHCAEADVLHLACHAQFRADNPVFSALHLHDGPLTAEAVESMRLRCAVVVLSACETALHGVQGGDEVFGLTRAFLVAGAQRVLASTRCAPWTTPPPPS
jgi:tetratricopeptide (TPR) repeat protein